MKDKRIIKIYISEIGCHKFILNDHGEYGMYTVWSILPNFRLKTPNSDKIFPSRLLLDQKDLAVRLFNMRCTDQGKRHKNLTGLPMGGGGVMKVLSSKQGHCKLLKQRGIFFFKFGTLLKKMTAPNVQKDL